MMQRQRAYYTCYDISAAPSIDYYATITLIRRAMIRYHTRDYVTIRLRRLQLLMMRCCYGHIARMSATPPAKTLRHYAPYYALRYYVTARGAMPPPLLR